MTAIMVGRIWTQGQLFGAAFVTDATGAQVTVNGQPA